MSGSSRQVQNNEQGLFGDNTASSLFIVSTSNDNYGKIIHTNEEVEYLLGFKRKDLIGQNVSCIMPVLLG
jgi:PAS domain S-box-containing protein